MPEKGKMLTLPDGTGIPFEEFDPRTMILGGTWAYLSGQKLLAAGFELVVHEGMTVSGPCDPFEMDFIGLEEPGWTPTNGKRWSMIGLAPNLRALLASPECEAAHD